MADEVMRTPKGSTGPDLSAAAAGSLVAPAIDRRDVAGSRRPDEIPPMLQTNGEGSGLSGETAPSEAAAPSGHGLLATVDDAVRGDGRPLGADVLQFMENRFGQELGDVRVHTNVRADELARQVSARAFTTGNHVFFARGEYQPEHEPGRRLLAHELTHVVQQDRSTRTAVQREPAEHGEHHAQRQGPTKQNPPGAAAESTTVPARGKDPSCNSIYGPPGTPPTHTLVLAQTEIETRAHENLDSWDPYLLQPIPELVGNLFRREEELSWFAAFATKVIGEAIEGLAGEEMLPVKMLLQGFAEIGEHLEERRLEAAKAEMTKKVTAKLKGERDEMKKDADTHIQLSFATMRAIKLPGCGADLQALKNRVEQRWPPMTAEKLEEVEQLVTRVMQRIRDEEDKRKRIEYYNECMRIELERPGGVPSEEEQEAARGKCNEKSLEAYPW